MTHRKEVITAVNELIIHVLFYSYFKIGIQRNVFHYVIFGPYFFLVHPRPLPLIKEKLRKKLGERTYKITQAVQINVKGTTQLQKWVIKGT